MHEFFEKIDIFNNILYSETYKGYTINGLRTMPVTKITSSVIPPFDDVKVSTNSAIKKLKAQHKDDITYIPPDEEVEKLAAQLRAEWEMTNKISNEKGTAVHKFIESAIAQKFEYYPAWKIKKAFNGVDPVKEKYDKCIQHVNKFLTDIRGKMYPVKSEFMIGSPEYRACGTVDQLFYNTKSKMFEIWDWKTNSKFETESAFHLNTPVSHLTNCQLDDYSLQLACYKKMFTEMTGIPIGNCYLCWFNENEDSYRIFKAKNLPDEATKLLQWAKIQMEAKDKGETPWA